jgi:hypothetical protein
MYHCCVDFKGAGNKDNALMAVEHRVKVDEAV